MRRNKSILIVDEDQSFASKIGEFLSEQGMRTSVITSGEEALDSISNNKFDLVISGLLMNEMHGLSILSKVKTTSPNTPVIIITGVASIKTAVEALRLGAYDYLIKPCEDEELLLRVKRAFGKSEMESRLLEAQKKSMFSATVITANHEINQPLTAIYGAVGLIEMELEELKVTDAMIETQLKNIFTNAQRISDILQRMKKISKPILKTYAQNVKMIQLGGKPGVSAETAKHQVKSKSFLDHTILVVDDEEAVRYMIESALVKTGYSCLSACDAMKALELFKKHQSEISMVITDVRMPKVSGKELYHMLKEIEPGIKVLLSSGYDVDREIRVLLNNGAAGFLQKPFSVTELTESVRKTLA
jgi:DNA-binding NtrC family response regulator